MYQINDLSALASSYLEPLQIKSIERAYKFSAQAHAGQTRISGEDYIHHPLEVAKILADMQMDHQTLMAAILHDVLEDTPTAKSDIKKKFGENVATLVDGVSKLPHFNHDSYEEAQAQNFCKMLMAVNSDIRVIMVKLADRLHNMRTINVLPVAKQRRIAKETLEIYVPIAQRLGLNNIHLELEELGFKVLYPMRYRVLNKQVKKARGDRKKLILDIKETFRQRLEQEAIPAKILGREKNLYSIYRKMQRNTLSFNEIHDVYAFRIIVNSVDACYRALGVVHNLYKPVPGKFKDYIAIPKSNGYQSLHTFLFGQDGTYVEAQIRTNEMNDMAEFGIAAHWLYKSGAHQDDSSNTHTHHHAREWLKHLIEMQKRTGNSKEFFEHVKVDLFPDSVYVFTPKGKIIELPRGATAVDFAYAIHTDVGNHCTGARIDRHLVPLGTILASGETIEIITSESGTPNPSWLKFVVTARARSHIRHYVKNLKQDEACALGLRLLNRELNKLDKRYDQVETDKLNNLLDKYQLDNEQALLEEIGIGNRMAPLIARHLVDMDVAKNKDNHLQPFFIKGTEGMVVHFPKCCYPIPGDSIIGFASAGRGIMIHNRLCKNIAKFRHHPEKWLDVQWADDIDRTFPKPIQVQVLNQRGMLAAVAATISAQEANIVSVDIEDKADIKNKDNNYILLTFIIEVINRQHFAQVIRRVRRINNVSLRGMTKVK